MIVKMRKLTLITCLTISYGLFAQERVNSFAFSLKEAIDCAQKNSYSVLNASKDLIMFLASAKAV